MSNPTDGLLALATAESAPADLLAAAVALCAQTAIGAAAYTFTPGGMSAVASVGDVPADVPSAPAEGAVGAALPLDWMRIEGNRTDVAVQSGDGALTLLSAYACIDVDALRQIAEVTRVALARRLREDRLADRVRHFTAAQRISHVGSYDFDITTNTNIWSDQLYLIYGREPQSFMATYEKFMELVQPEDREFIVGVHQQALATLLPYEMEERIVWPNGEVRTLASWGEVVAGADGTPTRMVGICWDITEQKQTSAALARSGERFQRLIQSAPDVVLVVASDGTITQANDRVLELLGWEPSAVVGQPISALLDGPFGAEETPREMTARTCHGEQIPVEVSISNIDTEDGVVTAAFVRDLRDRKRSEELGMRLHDASVRRRHALEINDNVVQGLASVLYLMDLNRYESAHAAARHTMAAARGMMNGLLERSGPTEPGELVREAGHTGSLNEPAAPSRPAAADALRLVIADDAADIRLLLRLSIATSKGLEIVGEAANGREAVEVVSAQHPDVVLLDLSMPVMDGLQAIPEIRRVSPNTKIVILSGFDQSRMKPVAMELGAHAYIEKGDATTGLLEMLAELFPDHRLDEPDHNPLDPDGGDPGGLAFDGDMVVHELRTPLTVITGMLSTLRERMDILPSATTHELIDAARRNARQMSELLDAVSDARHAANGQLAVVLEPTDIAGVVRDAAIDVAAGRGAVLPHVDADGPVLVQADPIRIRQAIVNLVSNAYKFAPAGTPVTVRVSASDTVAEISVTDRGPGIPSEQRTELFTKFGRLGQSGQGMGLGLYISRAIARAHGGELELRDGAGTTFVLTLPLTVIARSADTPAG